MSTDRLIHRAAALGLATLFTLTVLAGLDALAVEQHAATGMAKSGAQVPQTVAAKTPVVCS